MRKALKIYAIANTTAWAFVGIGVYLGHCYIRYDPNAGSPGQQATECANECFSAAFLGWKWWISSCFDGVKRRL